MCLMLYIAGSEPLPLVPYIKREPSFSVSEVSGYNLCVKRQFTLPYVYYAGSHEGCGCGFLKEWEIGEELEKIEDNYSKLSAYIHGACRRGIAIQLFSCWAGDQDSTPEFRESIDEDDLKDKEFEFKEKAFYQIK
jgi:hypothetical protein